ncbi:ABC transporter permease [Dongia sp.]|uniref:ABC transporter permease n=1 Tax=Dongia sp. TaxID=1977262 RepID=UPI00375088C5
MSLITEVVREISKLPRAAKIPVGLFLLVAIFGPMLAPYDPVAQNLLDAKQGFSWTHLLGTDNLGRDTLSRLLAAARVSAVGISFVLGIALAIGVTLGAIAGFMRGVVDEFIMRLVDVGQSVPSLVVALAVIGVFGTGFDIMILALALAWWPGYARVSRAVVTSVLQQPHIETLYVLGAHPARIFLLHLLPTAIGAVIVYASADAGAIALTIATLSFLGLGIQPPTAEWGQMVVDALPFLETHPLQVLLPGAALTLVVVGFNVLGEAVALGKTPRPLARRTIRERRTEALKAGLAS